MFNSSILDVAIGIVFAFLTVSIVTSAIVEALSSMLKWRSGTLLDGVKALVNDPTFTQLALQLYGHASINPLGTAPDKRLPAYIDRAQFAKALLDVTGMTGRERGPPSSSRARRPSPP